MDPILLLFSLILISFGLANLYRPFVEWFIRFDNKRRGIKTEITETAIAWYRFGGFISILAGFTILLIGVFG